MVPAVVVGAATGVALGLWSSLGAAYRGLIIGSSVAIAFGRGAVVPAAETARVISPRCRRQVSQEFRR